MVFDPLLDTNDATLQTHVGLPDAEGALLEIEFVGIKEEINVVDADFFIETRHLHHGIVKHKVGQRIPLVQEIFLVFVLIH